MQFLCSAHLNFSSIMMRTILNAFSLHLDHYLCRCHLVLQNFLACFAHRLSCTLFWMGKGLACFARTRYLGYEVTHSFSLLLPLKLELRL